MKMKIIIAGPQGCGKSHMASIIQEAFEEDQQAGLLPADTTLEIEERQVHGDIIDFAVQQMAKTIRERK